MNEHQQALLKKIKGTEEELARLNQDKLTNSEYHFINKILHLRLSHLKSQFGHLVEQTAHEDPSKKTKIVEKETTSPAWAIQLSIHQKASDSNLSLRTLSYFLYGMHQLLDQLIEEEHKPAELLVQLKNDVPMTLEFSAHQQEEPITDYNRVFGLLTQLLQQSEFDDFPAYLLEIDSLTFGYAKRWISFLIESQLELSFIFPNLFSISDLFIDQERLSKTLHNLKQIRKEMEPFSVSGVLNAINLREQKMEIIMKVSSKPIRIKCNPTALKQSRNLLGEYITVVGTSHTTENLVNGKISVIRILKEIKEG